eukprot:1151663-Pelagomonas_calceolata.AAC.1
MRIGRVVGHALRRPDSPSPCIHLRAPSEPPPEAPSKQRACLVLMIVVSCIDSVLRFFVHTCRVTCRERQVVQRACALKGSSGACLLQGSVGGVIYTPHTLEPLKDLGPHTHTAIKLALKLHAHSVQCAYKL